MLHPINKQEVFVIIPAYNEQSIIRSVIDNLLPYGYNVVIIDDGSAINLYPLLKNEPVFLLRHRINLGQGAAIQTGIEFALSKQAAYVVTFDADGQHEASDIERLLQALATSKVDIVSGSRFMKGAPHNMTQGRKMLLQLARYLNYFFSGLLLTDAHNGLRAMTNRAAAKIHILENGMAHATELLSEIKKNNLSYSEIPVTIHYTAYSKQKGQTIWSGFRIFFDLLLNKFFK